MLAIIILIHSVSHEEWPFAASWRCIDVKILLPPSRSLHTGKGDRQVDQLLLSSVVGLQSDHDEGGNAEAGI